MQYYRMGLVFAIGALLAVAFWGLIPRGICRQLGRSQFQALSGTILAGILGFFVLEKLLI